MNKPEYKASIVSVAIGYCVVEMIVGIILLACQVKGLAWPFIAQTAMFAITLMICLGIYSLDKRKNL